MLLPECSSAQSITYTLKNKAGKVYQYKMINLNNTYYFSPFGTYGRYADLEYDTDNLIVPHAKKQAKKLGVPFQYLGFKKYEIDHLLMRPVRTVLGLTNPNSRDVAYAVYCSWFFK